MTKKKLVEDTLSNAEGADTCHAHVSIGNSHGSPRVFRVGWSCFQSFGDQVFHVFSLGQTEVLLVCSLCVAAGFVSLCFPSKGPVAW